MKDDPLTIKNVLAALFWWFIVLVMIWAWMPPAAAEISQYDPPAVSTPGLNDILAENATSPLSMSTGDHVITGGKLFFGGAASGTIYINANEDSSLYLRGSMQQGYLNPPGAPYYPYWTMPRLYTDAFTGTGFEAGLIIGKIAGSARGIVIRQNTPVTNLQPFVIEDNTGNPNFFIDGKGQVSIAHTVTYTDSSESLNVYHDVDGLGAQILNRAAAPTIGAALTLRHDSVADGGGIGRITFTNGLWNEDVSINVKRVDANNNRLYFNVQKGGAAATFLELDAPNDRAEVGTALDSANLIIFGNVSASSTIRSDVSIGAGIATLPTCDATARGDMTTFEQPAGDGDVLKVCMKDYSGAYAWATAATAISWNDLQVPGFSVRTGASAPGFESGFAGDATLYNYNFNGINTTEIVYFSVQFPHNYIPGSTFYPHVHWSPTTTGTGTVKWNIECSDADIYGTFAAGLTASGTTTIPSDQQWDHIVTDIPAGGATGGGISSIGVCRLFRDPTDPADTYDADAALLSIDWHIQVDSLGSRKIDIR